MRMVVNALSAIALLVLFVVLIFKWCREERIVCERATGRPRCTVEVNGLASSDTTVYDDLTGVRAIEHETRGVWYMLGLRDRAGRETEVVELPEEDAQRAETWFVEREQRVEIAVNHQTIGMLFGLVVGLLVFALNVWGFQSDWRARRARG